jgi:hypothetical protein
LKPLIELLSVYCFTEKVSGSMINTLLQSVIPFGSVTLVKFPPMNIDPELSIHLQYVVFASVPLPPLNT